MHIAYDSQIFRMQQNGGISKYFVKLIENLMLEQNVKTTVVAGIHKNEFLINSDIKYSGMLYDGLKRKFINNRFYNFTKIFNLFIEKNKLSDSSIDIIHQTYNGYELYKNKKAKCIITIHDLIYEKFPNDFIYTNNYLIRKKKSIENADHIICVSKNTQNDLIKYYNVDIAKTSLVYHGVDEFTKQNNKLMTIPYILFVGKRNGYKNFTNTLKAFAQTKLKNEVKLICFGSSPFNNEEQEMIHQLELKAAIIYLTGNDLELVNLYQNATFLIYPSIYEGFGLPVLEAMANNCPVICSNKSSLPEVANNCALLIDTESEDSIKLAMEKLYFDKELQLSLKELGKANVKKFTWQNTALKTLKVYEKILNLNA